MRFWVLRTFYLSICSLDCCSDEGPKLTPNFVVFSVVLEQIMLAPRTVYTIGDDIQKKEAIQDVLPVTERTGLLVKQCQQTATTYLAGNIDTATEPPSLLFCREDVHDDDDDSECGKTLPAIDITSSGDPLTGKLFGRSATQQVMSSWFW